MVPMGKLFIDLNLSDGGLYFSPDKFPKFLSGLTYAQFERFFHLCWPCRQPVLRKLRDYFSIFVLWKSRKRFCADGPF
jgi:hypothetical protein